jgi:hypothetical protein
VLDLYFEEIQNDFGLNREELTGDFFRSTHGVSGKKFTNIGIGKNMIGKVGIEAAQELGLANPERYTGHCWRRSCGTSASDAGVNVTTLMSMMGWSNPKTAMVYVNKSRLTSLTMALYLANVQRTNIENPFPSTAAERRQVKRQSEGNFVANPAKANSANCPEVAIASALTSAGIEPKVEAGSSLESSEFNFDDEVELATQDLLRDIEAEDKREKEEVVKARSNTPESLAINSDVSHGSNVSGESLSANMSIVDPRLSHILQNLNNSGNINIHFHFGSDSKL